MTSKKSAAQIRRMVRRAQERGVTYEHTIKKPLPPSLATEANAGTSTKSNQLKTTNDESLQVEDIPCDAENLKGERICYTK